MMKPDRANPWRIANVKTVSYCTLCVVIIGFILLLAGAILTGIAYTEVPPNIADENYQRYIKTSVTRVVGPIMLAFGILNIIGGCAFFGVALLSSSKNQKRNKKYFQTQIQHDMPDADKKMLGQV